jgi:predicted transcriptional regulator
MNHIKHKVAKVGVISLEDFKRRTIAIAKGKYKPKKDEPKIWFNSVKSLANILSEENQKLLKLIVEMNPQSIKELENITGRKANNLLRTLRTLESYGFVRLKEGKSSKGRAPLISEVIYGSAEIKFNWLDK